MSAVTIVTGGLSRPLRRFGRAEMSDEVREATGAVTAAREAYLDVAALDGEVAHHVGAVGELVSQLVSQLTDGE